MIGLFRRFATRREAESRLLLADVAVDACAAFHATGLLDRASRLLDGVVLFCWILIPHLTARRLRAKPLSSDFRRALPHSLAITTLAFGLAVAGWMLVVAPDFDPDAPGLATGALLVLCWGSGFLLFVPQSYRLHDALAGGVLLVGCVEGRPDAALFGSGMLLAMALSAPLRHLVFDVTDPVRDADDLFDVGGLLGRGLLAGALMVAVFLGAEQGLGSNRIFRGTGSAASRGEKFGSSRRGEADRASVVSYTNRPGLSNLGERRFDQSVAFEAEVLPVDAPLDALTAEGPLVDAVGLWRTGVYRGLDGTGEGFIEIRGIRIGPAAAIGNPRPPIRNLANWDLRMVVRNRDMQTIAAPYGWRRAELFGRNGEPLDLTSSNEILAPARGELQRGEGATIRVIPQPRTEILDLRAVRKPRSLPSGYSQMFPPEVLGFDPAVLQARVFGPADTLVEHLERLQNYFGSSFRYDPSATWTKDEPRSLGGFLERHRSGDCSYFAVSTMVLLRAAGWPVRLATGFSGGEYDAARRTIVVRNSSFHAWCEVDGGDFGWLPIDPTTWVRDRVLLPVESTVRVPGIWERLDWPARLARMIIPILGLVLLVFLLPRKRQGAIRAARVDAAALSERPVLAESVARTTRSRILAAYHAFGRRLVRRRLDRAQAETPREHARRLGLRRAAAQESLDRCVEQVYAAAYGPEEPSPAAADDFDGLCRRIEKEID